MPTDPKPAKRSKRRPRRLGVASRVAPPDRFRLDVAAHYGYSCVVCGRQGGHRGEFDPAHLIPATMIRTEARTTPALEDWVYTPRIAVWACRAHHFAHDYPGAAGDSPITRDVLKRCGAWPDLLEAAERMDGARRDAGLAGDPFTAYIERTFPASVQGDKG